MYRVPPVSNPNSFIKSLSRQIVGKLGKETVNKTSRAHLNLGASVAVITLLLGGSTAYAQTVIWSGAQDNQWNVGTNWIDDAVPTAINDVVIDNDNDSGQANATITMAGAVASTVTVGTEIFGGVLAIAGPGTLTVGGNVTLGVLGTGTINLSTGGQLTTESADIGAGGNGILVVTGAGSLWSNGGDAVVGDASAGTIRAGSGGSIENAGTITVGSLGHIYLGTQLATGAIDGIGGTFTTNELALDGGMLQIYQNAATAVELGGTLSGDGEIFIVRGALDLTGDASAFAGTIDLASRSTTTSADTSLAILNLSTDLGANVAINAGTRTDGSTASEINLIGEGDYEVAATITGGTAAFTKGDDSTATLSGANSFVSDTGIVIDGGVLQVSADNNLGDVRNAVELNGGSLATTQDFTTIRDIILAADEGGFDVAEDTTSTLSGTLSGVGNLNKAGEGTLILDGTSSYEGDTNVAAGTLKGDAATIRGNVANDGTVVFDQASNGVFAGATTGEGDYVKDGVGSLSLTAASESDWSVNDGTLSASSSLFGGNAVIANGAEFALNGAGTFAGEITGGGSFTKSGTGLLELTADNSAFAGETAVASGGLAVNNKLGGNVSVAGDASLSGSGIIGGNVVVAEDGNLVGQQGDTLSMGDLSLNGGANVNVSLGAPVSGVNEALFNVNGDLNLDGTINVSDLDSPEQTFRAGVYRIFDYAGDLTNNGLEVGNVPAAANASDVSVQTAVDHQVNLVNSTGVEVTFWDGQPDANKNNGEIEGGDGIWRNGDANWANANGSANAGWNSGLAIFGAAAGTVVVDDSVGSGGQVTAGGMQFTTNGYNITGDALALTETGDTGFSQIGTDSGVTATITAALQGSETIEKWGEGTLIIAGDSGGYEGSSLVSEGTLLVNGDLGGDVDVGTDGTLGGSGTIGGDVSVNDGTLVGEQGQTLAMGNLELSADSNINVILGEPGNTKGLFSVVGDLTLNGTLNVADAGNFGMGVYRIIDYTGELSGDGLLIGSHPEDFDLSVQTSIDHEVNLISGSDTEVQFWNGTTTEADNEINGGDGTWRADTRTNWTNSNGAVSNSWQQDVFAVFQGSAGHVTVDNGSGQVGVGGMQFAVDGYDVNGGSIALNSAEGPTVIRVGDATDEGANYVATIGSVLTGTTGLQKEDFGTLVLTGENTYTGGTTVANGTLMLGNGGTSGSIQGDVDVGGNLIFNRSDEFTFGGVISGEGLVGQVGSGTTLLTADSSGFNGDTVVANGGLSVSGSLGGTIEVRDGALLDGTGTVGDVTVLNGGTIGAGRTNTIGSFNTGDLTFNSGSNYLVNVAADGTADHIFSSGETVINGGLVDVRAGSGDYADQTRYTIITAEDGVTRSGTHNGFDDVTSDLAFLTPSLDYDGNNVYLVMDRNAFSFCLPGSTRNQCATGQGAESTGPGNPVYDAILNLNDPQARDAFDQLSGEIHASLKSGLIEDSRFVREAVGERIRNAFGDTGKPGKVLTYLPGTDVKDPTPQPVWIDADKADGVAVWSHGFGSWGEFAGDGNAAGLDRSIGGLFIGADAPVFDQFRLGLVGGYSHSTFSVDDRNSSGSSDNYNIGVYGGGQWDNLGVRVGADYTWHDISTGRSVDFPGYSDSLSADYDAATTQIYGDIGYKIDLGTVNFEPFAGLAYVNVNTDGFTENGGAAALTGYGDDTDATFSTLGVRAGTSFALGNVNLTADGSLGWRHTMEDVTPTNTQAFAGGDRFTVSGVPLAKDLAVVEAGVSAALNKSLTVGVSYSGQFGDGVKDQGLRGNLNWKF